MTEKWLEFHNIDAFIGNRKIINELNLELSLGENTVIIGPNGSGKSTIIKLIAKLIYPIAKENSYIKIFGSERTNIWDLRSKIGFVFSDIDLRIKHNTVVKDLILSGYIGTYGITNKQLFNSHQIEVLSDILKKLDLENESKKLYADLSDGMKRRVLIARSIINNPKILILDEPTCLLDVKSSYKLLEILSILSKEGMTIIYVTNTIEAIIKETNRVLFIKNGKLIEQGIPEELLLTEKISSLYEYNLKVISTDGYWRTVPCE